MLMMAMLLQAAAPAPVAPWTPVARPGANGSQALSASAEATGGSGGRLVLRCDGAQKVVSIQFLTRQMMSTMDSTGTYPDKGVLVRFDALPSIEYAWQATANGVYITDAEAVTAIAAGLAKAKTVTVQTSNASNFGLSATFAAPGGATQVTQVLTACGYTLGVVPPPLPATAQ